MGGAASTLPDARKEAIVCSLRGDLKDFGERGLPDMEVLEHLQERLKVLLASSDSSAAGTAATVSQSHGSTTGPPGAGKKDLPPTIVKKRVPAPSHGIGFYSGIKPLPKMKATRRRSFGGSDLKLKESQSQILIENSPAAEAEGTKLDDDPAAAFQTPQTDHWESVSQLPFCTVCQMAFKSASLLDRHTRYSDLHQKNVKNRMKEEGLDEETLSSSSRAGSDLMGWNQSNGEQYKLLYVGNKFFWRSGETIDLSFFHHLTSSAIEVVPFDSRVSKEFVRLYLDLHILHDYIHDDVEKEVEALRQQHVDANKHDKFQSNVFDATGERQRQTRIHITNFILGRLQLRQVMEDRPQREIWFMEETTTGLKSPLLPLPPRILVPVKLTHRRNTSTEEVQQKMTELKADQQALRANISQAEAVSGMVRRFVSMYGNSRRQLKQYSAPRVRWILAIRKVIQINASRAVREMLRKRGWQVTAGKASTSEATPGPSGQSGDNVPVANLTTLPNPSGGVEAAATRRRKSEDLYVQTREYSSPVVRTIVRNRKPSSAELPLDRQHVDDHDHEIVKEKASVFYEHTTAENEAAGEGLSADDREFLLEVARNQCPIVAEMLALKRVAVSIKNSFGRDGMQIAARNGSVPMLELLKANGGDVDTLGPHDDTLLHLAAANGHVDAMRWLQSNGVSPDAVNILGQTPAHIASRRGELKSLKFLDELGCDLKAKDMYGQTVRKTLSCFTVLLFGAFLIYCTTIYLRPPPHTNIFFSPPHNSLTRAFPAALLSRETKTPSTPAAPSSRRYRAPLQTATCRRPAGLTKLLFTFIISTFVPVTDKVHK